MPTKKTGLSKRDQAQFTRDTVECALESERYLVFMFRIDPDEPFNRFVPDHSMQHFPDGDYTKVMAYIRETIAEFVRPKNVAADEHKADNDSIPSSQGANNEEGNGQSKQAE